MQYPLDWEEKNNILVKVFNLNNFIQAVDFVQRIVPLAEDLNHHPDIEIFEYNKVKVKLTTHDVGSIITIKDIKLANEIDKLQT